MKAHLRSGVARARLLDPEPQADSQLRPAAPRPVIADLSVCRAVPHDDLQPDLRLSDRAEYLPGVTPNTPVVVTTALYFFHPATLGTSHPVQS